MIGESMSKRKNIIRTVGFCLVFLFLLTWSSRFFFVDTASSKTFVDSVMHEEPNTLQAVYLGNSGVYRYFQAPLAWEEYGIAVMNLATASQPAATVRFLLEEIRETQNPDVYIIDLRSFSYGTLTFSSIHNLINFIEPSWNKFKMIVACCAYSSIWYADLPEFFFPIIRFHDRWEELQAEDFEPLISDVKGAYTYSHFFRNTQSEVTRIVATEVRYPARDKSLRVLENLLDYCDENELNVLFVSSPFLEHERQKQIINSLGDVVQERGYDFINFNTEEVLEKIGLDVATDFMDSTHTNVRGSIIYTHYLAGVLTQVYGLENLQGSPGYESWDAAYRTYCDYLGESNKQFALSLIGERVTLPDVFLKHDTSEQGEHLAQGE